MLSNNPIKGLLDFFGKRSEAKRKVSAARTNGDKRDLADALIALGNIERRPPFARSAALRPYREAGQLYGELDLNLDEAWVLRHMGIIHEYAERLGDAENYYDEALALYRKHSTT